jgi:LacI family transcriptional regulator
MSQSITIKDIAKLLGLSKSTVSRALKDHPDISPETKRAVKEIAEKLHYKPNHVAISLRHRKSRMIGLLVPNISYFFFPSVIEGIEEIVHEHGYQLMILQSNESYEREVNSIDTMLANNVEVSRKTEDFSHFKNVIDRDIPIVFFDRVPEEIKADMVLVDDIRGTYDGVKHLLDTGRKQIAICIGHPNLLISKNRLKGYKMALNEVGLEVEEKYIISGQSIDDVERATHQLLNQENPPDGIFAISDLTMTGIMRAIYANRLRIPEDIAVIGFCEEPFSTMYNPPLSTIQPMGFEIGKMATEVLFTRIQAEHGFMMTPEIHNITSKMVIRGST